MQVIASHPYKRPSLCFQHPFCFVNCQGRKEGKQPHQQHTCRNSSAPGSAFSCSARSGSQAVTAQPMQALLAGDTAMLRVGVPGSCPLCWAQPHAAPPGGSVPFPTHPHLHVALFQTGQELPLLETEGCGLAPRSGGESKNTGGAAWPGIMSCCLGRRSHHPTRCTEPSFLLLSLPCFLFWLRVPLQDPTAHSTYTKPLPSLNNSPPRAAADLCPGVLMDFRCFRRPAQDTALPRGLLEAVCWEQDPDPRWLPARALSAPPQRPARARCHGPSASLGEASRGREGAASHVPVLPLTSATDLQ